ncbi:MAG: hypothetical protein ABI968_00535 [Acidobacteriota bacterium]
MNPVCAIVRSSFEDYLGEHLPQAQHRMLRDHLASCEDCREAAAAQDPTLLFARTIREEIPETDSRQILSAVRAGVELMRVERRIGPRARRRRIGPAAAAAVVALAVLTPGALRLRETPGAKASEASSQIPLAPASGAAAPAALRSAGLSEEAPPPSGATIYDWNPGAGREEPRVVWIVDRGLDI